MLFFSGCKINLGLRIVRKRDDGFHDIETVFYPVGWKDAIECLPSEKTAIDVLGKALDGNPDDNFVLKAYNALVEWKQLPPLRFKLLKNVPAGAGLGGGSANAAVTLKQLNKDFDGGLTSDRLARIALNIGSDCPFFLQDKACVATGRGETLKPIELDLSSYWLMIAFPEVHVNTAWAFKTFASQNRYRNNENALVEIVSQPIRTWKNSLTNDFEETVFDAHPRLADIKKYFYDIGAVYASLSGSGSSLFGIFPTKPDAKSISDAFNLKPENVWVEVGRRFNA